jgi:hypothetical protein
MSLPGYTTMSGANRASTSKERCPRIERVVLRERPPAWRAIAKWRLGATEPGNHLADEGGSIVDRTTGDLDE